MSQELKSIRVDWAGDRVNIVMANGVLGMTKEEALHLAWALRAVADGLLETKELWSEGTIGEKVEA